ncbi:MAG: hypothetical protein IJ881_01295 [Neisseriaceae bacterium]|nr:hypothetical protein [Neisseriaceae bacterium]MBR3425902.1 hypothetical protein [Neisseriaceae bacterium]
MFFYIHEEKILTVYVLVVCKTKPHHYYELCRKLGQTVQYALSQYQDKGSSRNIEQIAEQ